VWSEVKNSGNYNPAQLPSFKAGLGDFLSWTVENIRQAASRTISDRQDILPHFQKLVHANGICFAGEWNITEKNPYTGYFSQGSQGNIIVRASEASGSPTVGNFRAFGIAGKIYPTLSANTVSKTANFFTIDDLGGTKTRHFTDTTLTNEPPLSKNSTSAKGLSLVLTTASAFRLADSHISKRQLYEISELGMTDPKTAHTPTWMLIRASSGTPRIERADFRNELELKNYGGQLDFDILVASKGETTWSKIGTIHLTDEALTSGCDHNLHFHHPKWRKDIH